MKKLLLGGLFLNVCSLKAQDYWCLDKHLSIRADYGYFRRQEIRDLRLLEDTSEFIANNKPKKRLDTDDLMDQFHWKSAYRAGIIYHGEDCGSLEGLYTYFSPWNAEVEKSADGTLQFPFKNPLIAFDYREADKALVTYRSWLQNAEANYWGHITPQRVNYFAFSWNLGLRMVFLKEKLNLMFTKQEDTSNYIIKTRNALYGPQLGAVLEINPTCYWTWTFMVKGVGFLNDGKNKVEVGDLNNTIELRDYTKKKWIDSWLLEGYGQLSFHLFSWLSFEFAYQGFILTGLILAPEQRDVHTQEHRRINTEGQIVIDGFYAGLSISF